MTWDPNEHRLCLATNHDAQPGPCPWHRCGAPYGHDGPEHLCQHCGQWFRRDGGEPTA